MSTGYSVNQLEIEVMGLKNVDDGTYRIQVTVSNILNREEAMRLGTEVVSALQKAADEISAEEVGEETLAEFRKERRKKAN